MKKYIIIPFFVLYAKLLMAATPNYTFMDGKLEVFLAPDTNANVMVLCCPGGGYQHLAMNHEGYSFVSLFNPEGISLAILAYTMPHGNKDIPLNDVQTAFKLLNEHSGEWDIKNIGIMGFSAGGHLASTAATKFTSPANRPNFQILFYPVINMDADYTHCGSRDNLLGSKASKRLKTLYSNEKQVKADTPPAFILLSDDDKVVPSINSTLYYNALKKHKIPAEMYIFPSGGHGWGNKDSFAYQKIWQPLLLDWLKKR